MAFSHTSYFVTAQKGQKGFRKIILRKLFFIAKT